MLRVNTARPTVAEALRNPTTAPSKGTLAMAHVAQVEAIHIPRFRVVVVTSYEPIEPREGEPRLPNKAY